MALIVSPDLETHQKAKVLFSKFKRIFYVRPNNTILINTDELPEDLEMALTSIGCKVNK